MVEQVKIHRKKFKCIDKKDTVIWGDYASPSGQSIAVRFRMCEGGPSNGCETEEDIKNWLKPKFIVLLHNQRRFDNEGFYGEEAVEESMLIFIPVST